MGILEAIDRKFTGWEGWLVPADSRTKFEVRYFPPTDSYGTAGASHPSQPVNLLCNFALLRNINRKAFTYQWTLEAKRIS